MARRTSRLRTHAPSRTHTISNGVPVSQSATFASATLFVVSATMSDERRRAYDLLAPRYAWFTEGSATRDLVEARALLDSLA